MKCKRLKVQNLKGGSPWPVLECGGVVVDNGDVLIVRAEIAQRMLTQHLGYLSDDGDCERDSLSGGHYSVDKGEGAPVVESKPKPKPEPDPEQPPMAAEMDDKSMAEKKTRRRRKG